MAQTPSRMDLDALSPVGWVQEERRRQHAARGDQNHSTYKWHLILSEEMGEVSKVIEHRHEEKIAQAEYTRELEYELIQVAAVAVAWVEAIRRGEHTADAPICTCPACPGISVQNQVSAKV